MSEKNEQKKKEEPTGDDPFDIREVDDTPEPHEFQRRKWLMNLKPQEQTEGTPEVKSGSATGAPPPLAGGPAGPPARTSTPPRAAPRPAPKPSGANVSMDKPRPRTDAPAISSPDAS